MSENTPETPVITEPTTPTGVAALIASVALGTASVGDSNAPLPDGPIVEVPENHPFLDAIRQSIEDEGTIPTGQPFDTKGFLTLLVAVLESDGAISATSAKTLTGLFDGTVSFVDGE